MGCSFRDNSKLLRLDKSFPTGEVGGSGCWSCAWQAWADCDNALAVEAPAAVAGSRGRRLSPTEVVWFLVSTLYQDYGPALLLLGRKGAAGLR